MPAILLALGSLLVQLARTYLPGIVGRVLLALGIGFATHAFAVGPMLALLQSYVSGMPAVLVQTFSAIGLDKVCTMLFSAYAARAASRLLLVKRG